MSKKPDSHDHQIEQQEWSSLPLNYRIVAYIRSFVAISVTFLILFLAGTFASKVLNLIIPVIKLIIYVLIIYILLINKHFSMFRTSILHPGHGPLKLFQNLWSGTRSFIEDYYGKNIWKKIEESLKKWSGS